MKYLAILLVAAGSAVTVTGGGDDRDRIAKTVDGFFTSISKNDLDSLAACFPAFRELEIGQQDAYLTVFAGFTGWEIESVAVSGDSAIAVVKSVSGSGTVTLHIPLMRLEKRWEERWVVTERTSMRSDIGTVEAE